MSHKESRKLFRPRTGKCDCVMGPRETRYVDCDPPSGHHHAAYDGEDMTPVKRL